MKPKVDKKSPYPLYLQIKQILEKAIDEDRISPDSPIPDERTIAKIQKVAIPTVNRAIDELVQEGILYRIRGKGTFVKKREGKINHTLIGIAFTGTYKNNPYLSSILISAGCELAKRECPSRLFHIDEDNEGSLHSFLNSGINGLILANNTSLRVILKIKESGIPFIWLNNDITGEDLYCVSTDHFAAASIGLEHLAKLGHKRIAILKGPETGRYSTIIKQAYISSFERLGLLYDENIVKECLWEDAQTGRKAARELMSLPDAPTAIFAIDDVLAASAIVEMLSMGIKVPEDVSVIGTGNFASDAFSPVPLTTIDIHIDKMSSAAVNMLFKLIQNKRIDSKKVVLQPTLLIKESCNSKSVVRDL
jgi:DNA-binding LacI/PurR family transcriptional regulator